MAKKFHAFNMSEGIFNWDDQTRTAQITKTIVHGDTPEEAVSELRERFPGKGFLANHWLLVEVNDDVSFSFGVETVVVTSSGVSHIPERNQEQLDTYRR